MRTFRAGNIGEEIEIVEIMPEEAPLTVPETWPSEAPAEPTPSPAEPLVPAEPGRREMTPA